MEVLSRKMPLQLAQSSEDSRVVRSLCHKACRLLHGQMHQANRVEDAPQGKEPGQGVHVSVAPLISRRP
jgi:ABC-type polysaccharide/polyol phosphate transport system ATPase subunit